MIQTQPRERRRRANQVRILEAATQIASTEGLAALSIKRVADASDYTPGALYRYYPSKDALLTAVAAHVVGGLATRLRAVAADFEGIESVVRQVGAYRRYSVDEPHAFALIAGMLAEPRVLLEDARDAMVVGVSMRDALLPLAEALHAASLTGELGHGDVRERALVLFAGVQGALQMRKQERVMPGVVDADRLARQILIAILMGWGADSEKVTALVGDEE